MVVGVTFLPRTALLDRVACRLGIWSLRRLYGANCETDVRDDFPGENLHCISCDATRLVKSMQEILHEARVAGEVGKLQRTAKLAQVKRRTGMPGVFGCAMGALIACELTEWAWYSREGVVVVFAIAMWAGLAGVVKDRLRLRRIGRP